MARESYAERRAREDARARKEGELAEREAQLGKRQQALSAARAPRSGRGRRGPVAAAGSATVAAGAAKARTPYLALTIGTAAISLVQLTRNDKLTAEQRHAALFAIVLLVLVIGFVGELSPGIATGFGALLFISVLLGGTDAVSYIFETIPRRLLAPKVAA